MLPLLCAVLGGALASVLIEPKMALAARLAFGAAVGIAAEALLALALADRFGLTPAVVAAASWTTLLGPLALVAARGAARNRPMRLRFRRRRTLPALLLGATLAGLTLYFRALLCEKPDGLYIGAMDAWADLPYHFAIIQGFVQGQNFPPEDPLLAGARLAYPYLIDFAAALSVRAGQPMVPALIWQDVALTGALAVLLHRFAYQATRDRIAAWIAPTLLFFGGGLGFVLLLIDRAPLTRIPYDITRHEPYFQWGNPLVFWYSSMRGMLLAAPLLVAVWSLWWEAAHGARADAPRRLLAAGALTGLMPLAHLHSYAATVAMAAGIALLHRDRWRLWWRFFLPAVALAAPQLLYAASQSAVRAATFFGWHLGWSHGEFPAATFWIWNLGAFLPLSLLGLRWAAPARLRRFAAPFLLCFAVPNVVKLAPWEWDNIKVLAIWCLAFCPVVAAVLAGLWRSRAWPGKPVAAVLLLLLTLSGALDVWRTASAQNQWRIFDPDQFAFAALVERETPPRAVLLSAPTHNPPHQLAGRRTVLGYPGFLWTHGLDYARNEEDLRTMYAGGPAAEALLGRYRVDFVVIGPQERDNLAYHGKPLNEAWYARFPSWQVGGAQDARQAYGLYDVRPLRSPAALASLSP